MSMLERRGILLFEPDLIVERLQLPAGTELVGASVNTKLGGVLELVVTHPSLSACEPGAMPVTVSLYIERKFR